MIFALLIVTATFRPAAPTVGDPITIQFEHAVTLDPSEQYEVISQDGPTVVVRTFRPEPFELAGVVGNIRFQRLAIPVTSVLEPDDQLQPAPLKAPVQPAASRRPFIAIGGAAAAAALAWLAAWLLARRAMTPRAVVPPLDPAEQFRLTVGQLRRNGSQPGRWAELADATRRYLANTDPALRLELTTSELLARSSQEALRTVLHQGDLEKFSPWGAAAADFDVIAQRALGLIPAPQPEEKAA